MVRHDSIASFLAKASTHHSSSLESLLEHVFVSEVLQEAWFGRGQIVEVLRAEVDAGGYDVVFECGSVTRHVQVKGSAGDSRTALQTLNVRLADKPSGCVVWLLYTPRPEAGRVDLTYLWFGAGPGEKLPDLGDVQGQNPRSKTPRPNTRKVSRGDFDPVTTTAELLDRLFGPAPTPA